MQKFRNHEVRQILTILIQCNTQVIGIHFWITNVIIRAAIGSTEHSSHDNLIIQLNLIVGI